MKVKLIVGFRRDQEHSISAEEAHKAYYLFLNPTARGVFSNGLAIKGDQIQEIIPDWQGTMGWNPTHILDSDDWNEIRKSGMDMKMRHLLNAAKEIATQAAPQELNQPLQALIADKYAHLLPQTTERREGRVQSIKQILDKNP